MVWDPVANFAAVSATTHTHDVIIIGTGLAGTVLSETLALQGLRVLVFDVAQKGSASNVAAGMVNPIVLRRTVPSWRAGEMLAIAGAFYRDLEMRYDTALWYPFSMAALFPTAQEAGIWQRRLKDPVVAPFLGEEPSKDPAVLAMPQPYAHGTVKRCARLDVRKLIAMHRSRWLASGLLIEQRVDESDIHQLPDGVEVHGNTAPMLVHCKGPFSHSSGLVLVRGEGLTVRIPGLGLNTIVHRGVFILPIGEDVYRVGATFAWDKVWSGPTEEARHYLMDGLQRLITRPIEVLEHWAGVRPASSDRRPILGRTGPHEAIFNGLGSRGVLLAPWCAQHLTDHLFKGVPLDPEVDLERFAE